MVEVSFSELLKRIKNGKKENNQKKFEPEPKKNIGIHQSPDPKEIPPQCRPGNKTYRLKRHNI